LNNFKFRGVVEGFYGEPWEHIDRLYMLDFFKEFNFNTYVIAPKNDPQQRLRWREKLDDNKIVDLIELVTKGINLDINVSTSVSPGADVQYSSSTDVIAVVQRFSQQTELGCKHLFLFWDDIDWELQYEEDKEIYPNIAAAQADFSNKVAEYFPNVIFTICPMIYWGRNKSEYLEELGKNLNQSINIMWTGRQIRSEYIDTVDAKLFKDISGRKPFYWDNFPVNNLSMRHELHFGPLQGREKNLQTQSIGLLANPMLQPRASLISLATIGTYLNDPENYNAEDAWESAFQKLYGNLKENIALRIFLNSSMGSIFESNWSPDLRQTLNGMHKYILSKKFDKAAELAKKFAENISSSYSTLTSVEFFDERLQSEIEPWIKDFKKNEEILRTLASILSATTLNAEQILALQNQCNSHIFAVYKDCLWEFLQELYFLAKAS
jgi:hyaluronoglucosaminidase